MIKFIELKFPMLLQPLTIDKRIPKDVIDYIDVEGGFVLQNNGELTNHLYKFNVDEYFKIIYDMFGEDAFFDFFKEYHDIDFRVKTNKRGRIVFR